MTSEEVTFWVSVWDDGDRQVFQMRARPALVNQLADELQAQKASLAVVGSSNGQAIGEVLFSVSTVIGSAGGIAGGTAVLIRAMTGFLQRHDGKEITAHIGQGEGRPLTLKGYPKKDAIEILRLAREDADTHPSSPSTDGELKASAEDESS